MKGIASRLRTLSSNQCGTSAVEFALIGWAFLLLILGVIDFGLGIWTYNNLAEATREGARYAIVRGKGSTIGTVGPGTQSTTCADGGLSGVASVVCAFSFPLDPSKLAVTARWPDGQNLVSERVEVSAVYQYSPFVSNLIPVNIDLRSSSTMFIACCD